MHVQDPCARVQGGPGPPPFSAIPWLQRGGWSATRTNRSKSRSLLGMSSCAHLPGDSWRWRHDEIKLCIVNLCNQSKVRAEAEVPETVADVQFDILLEIFENCWFDHIFPTFQHNNHDLQRKIHICYYKCVLWNLKRLYIYFLFIFFFLHFWALLTICYTDCNL